MAGRCCWVGQWRRWCCLPRTFFPPSQAAPDSTEDRQGINQWKVVFFLNCWLFPIFFQPRVFCCSKTAFSSHVPYFIQQMSFDFEDICELEEPEDSPLHNSVISLSGLSIPGSSSKESLQDPSGRSPKQGGSNLEDREAGEEGEAWRPRINHHRKSKVGFSKNVFSR